MVRISLRSLLLTVASVAAGAATAGAVVLYAGLYNIAATHQHLAITYRILEVGLRESIKHHARDIIAPPAADAHDARRGLALYRDHCVQCHGAPGVAPEPFALGLKPLPSNLAHSARELTAGQLYWVVKNGIKMTAMPAWEFRFSQGELWAVVAFLKELPFYTPSQYSSLESAPHVHKEGQEKTAPAATAVDTRRGRRALDQYACTTCHAIPGIIGRSAPVGPPLERIGTRETIAGVLPNTPQNMVRWLRDPREINPRSAMPNLGVTERDARDIAAYLYTLK